MSPEESKQLTSCPTTAQTPPGSPATQLDKCLPVSVESVEPGKEDVSGSPVDPKPQDLLVPLEREEAAGKGEDEHQPPAPKPAEFVSDSPSKSCNQSSHNVVKATEEATQMELAGERPHTICSESSGSENGSKPKSPASVGVGACQREESLEQAKETPSPSMEEMDTGVQGLKRKAQSPEEALTMPEKRPHVSENCSSGSSFHSTSQPFPSAPVPKVPPLRVTKLFAWLHLCTSHSYQLTGFSLQSGDLPLHNGRKKSGLGMSKCRILLVEPYSSLCIRGALVKEYWNRHLLQILESS